MILLIGSMGSTGAVKVGAELNKLNEARVLLTNAKALSYTNPAKYSKTVVDALTSKVSGISKTLTEMGSLGVKALETNKIATSSKILSTIAKNAGYGAIVGKNTNNIIEQRIEQGANVTFGDIASVSASQFLLVGMDRFGLEQILTGSIIKNGFKTALSTADMEGRRSFASKLAETAIHIASGTAFEGGTEYLQTWGEILGKDLGVNGKTFESIINK